MALDVIYRNQGDTAPGLSQLLLLNGSPFNLQGASVYAIIAGTVGSGPAATYVKHILAATWSVASAGSIAVNLNPSALAPSNYPCASPANLSWEVEAVDSTGAKYTWPQRGTIPFIVRKEL